MKLVGEAMHKYGLDVPVVGVAPFGALQGRHLLENCKVCECQTITSVDPTARRQLVAQSHPFLQGERVNYWEAIKVGGEGARLNPYHTHQILVDTARAYDKSTVVYGQEQVLNRTETKRSLQS